MKLLVLGATGPTGREVVSQALAAGHEVTAYVRNPTRLERAKGLHVAAGDATDGAALERALERQNAVVSTLGRGRSLRSEKLISRSMGALAPAMERRRVKRLIVMSSFGVGESRRDAPPLLRLMHLLLRDIFADKQAAEDYLRTTRLDWTFVYPVGLTDGPRTGRYRAGERLELRGWPTISRADVADFIVKEFRVARYVRRTVVLSG